MDLGMDALRLSVYKRNHASVTTCSMSVLWATWYTQHCLSTVTVDAVNHALLCMYVYI